MAQDSASRKLDQYIVRFPDGMRDRLKAAAAESNRSLNAEIVARLEAYDGLHSLLVENAAERQRLEAENIVLEGAVEAAVRLPIGLHDRIEKVADGRERTVTEEVVQALEAAFPPPPSLQDVYKVWEVYREIAENNAALFGKDGTPTLREFLLSGLAKFSADVEAGKYAGAGLSRIEAEIDALFPEEVKR